MKRGPTIFLQLVIVAIGIGAIVLLLWEPHLEGRNSHATLFEIYFKDPFLAYIYLGSLPFFFACYQAFRILEYVRENKSFSQVTVNAFRTIKNCAITIALFILGAEGYIFVFQRGKEDIAGGVTVGLVIIFLSAVVATAAALFEKLLQNVVDIKSENDLTV